MLTDRAVFDYGPLEAEQAEDETRQGGDWQRLANTKASAKRLSLIALGNQGKRSPEYSLPRIT